MDSLDYILRETGKDRATFILNRLQEEMDKAGHPLPFTANTVYVNTIPAHQEPKYPGNIALEKRIRSLVRWNAMAMVVRANRLCPGIGGHISTFASLAMLLEVGFNHFFRASSNNSPGDQVYFQDTPLPVFTPVRFWKDGCQNNNWKIFGGNCSQGAGYLLIPIHG